MPQIDPERMEHMSESNLSASESRIAPFSFIQTLTSCLRVRSLCVRSTQSELEGEGYREDHFEDNQEEKSGSLSQDLLNLKGKL